MELGLKKDEVKIVPYNAQWKSEFERVKKLMLHVLNVNESQIEHIGIAAIKGMKAKPYNRYFVGECIRMYSSGLKGFIVNWILPLTCGKGK